jgi:hypothetical protein
LIAIYVSLFPPEAPRRARTEATDAEVASSGWRREFSTAIVVCVKIKTADDDASVTVVGVVDACSSTGI